LKSEGTGFPQYMDIEDHGAARPAAAKNELPQEDAVRQAATNFPFSRGARRVAESAEKKSSRNCAILTDCRAKEKLHKFFSLSSLCSLR